MKTWTAKPLEIERKWWIVDATDKTLGRLATEIADTLRGKNKPQFTPHVDTGDFVVVLNSKKIKVKSISAKKILGKNAKINLGMNINKIKKIIK